MSNITIHSASIQDADAILKIYSHYVQTTAISFEYDVPSLDEFKGRIAYTLEKYPYLVAEQDGKIIGYAYGSQFHPRAAYQWCAEVSIYVDVDVRKKGVGRMLYEALEEAEATNANTLYMITDAEEELSTQVQIITWEDDD